MELSSRVRGCFLGIAVGDALGAPVETMARGSFPLVTELAGPLSGREGAIGEWTDDTSMTLCLAESLLDGGGRPGETMERYRRWYREGYLSASGRCFGSGGSIRAAIERFEATGALGVPEDEEQIGNGALMRIAPLALWYKREAEVEAAAFRESYLTHGSRTSAECSAYYALRIYYALRCPSSKRELLRAVPEERYARPAPAETARAHLEAFARIVGGEYEALREEELDARGSCTNTLRAALWAFWHASSFEEGMVKAVNLGGDADTTAAVYGALAGAFYGEEAIPLRWRERLLRQELILSFAERFVRALQ